MIRQLKVLFALLIITGNLPAQEFIHLWLTGKMPDSKGLQLKDSIAQDQIYQVGIPRMYTCLAPKEKIPVRLSLLFPVAATCG